MLESLRCTPELFLGTVLGNTGVQDMGGISGANQFVGFRRWGCPGIPWMVLECFSLDRAHTTCLVMIAPTRTAAELLFVYLFSGGGHDPSGRPADVHVLGDVP